MVKKTAGFALLELIVILVVVAALGIVGFKIFHSKHKPVQANEIAKVQSDQPLLLKSIGFNLGYYDPTTNRAGDMIFTHEDHDLGITHMIFGDFGIQDARSPNDPTKRNPQPTFVLPLGTKVHSLVDGVVVSVKSLYSGDYTIWVSSHEGSSYIYETEHVDNPLVKKGDHVSGGQIIGQVSDHDSQYHPGFGIVEIGILNPQPNGQAQHICPFHYLEPSIKTDIQKKILNVHQAWMQYIGMPNLYDDAHSAEPGCFTLDPVNG
ncbi:MAG TPA: M23 family metallopeptidase [Candidatus Saccharimonadales bacterium]|nr:M23 family metallopeptidase [Candidatus Saccharimonadales bacterium]